MTDTDRPSGATLSESEADRLSERFTPSWDDPNAWPSDEGDAPKSPPPAPAPVVAKPKNQTLLGIAPIVVVGPSRPPAAPASAPATAPASAPAAPASAPAAGPAAPAPTAALTSTAPLPSALKAAASSSSATSTPLASSPPSSPESSAVARGLTTPSKPYIPKDDPSTPAVVISEAALSEAQRRADRARIAQTIPAQTRSSAFGSPGPFVAPAAPAPPSATAAAVIDTPPPFRPRSRGPRLLLVAGLTLTAVAAGAFLLGSGPSKSLAPHDQAATEGPERSPAAATNDGAALPERQAEVAAAPSSPASDANGALTEDPNARAPEASAAVRPLATTDRKRKPASKKVATATGTSAARKTTSTRTPATEPGTSTKSSRGVIVRETPF